MSRASKVSECRAVYYNAVAVIADSWGRASLRSMRFRSCGNEGPNAPRCRAPSIRAWLKEGLDVDQARRQQTGDAKTALAAPPRNNEAVYSYPYHTIVT